MEFISVNRGERLNLVVLYEGSLLILSKFPVKGRTFLLQVASVFISA